jgi:hypothetical protein
MLVYLDSKEGSSKSTIRALGPQHRGADLLYGPAPFLQSGIDQKAASVSCEFRRRRGGGLAAHLARYLK